MQPFLQSLLDMSKDNPKSNFIESSDRRAQGIAGELGFYLNIKSDRYYNQPLVTWICTDTEVGLYAHYFDDKLIAISEQYARKSSQIYRWSSSDDKQAFEEYLQFMDMSSNIENGLSEKLVALHAKKDSFQRRISEIDNEISAIEYNYEYVSTPLIEDYDWKELVKAICSEYFNPQNGYFSDEMQLNKLKELLQ
jgi:hypothetical protein